MITTLFVFAAVFCIFTVLQVMQNKRNTGSLGKCVFKTNRKMKSSEFVVYLFRFITSILISIYFVMKGGEELQINLLIFSILMGALSSKIFSPFAKKISANGACGIYENGVITFQGTKLFKELQYYTFRLKNDEYLCAFVPKKAYFNRPAYFYIRQRELGRMNQLLTKKCICK